MEAIADKSTGPRRPVFLVQYEDKDVTTDIARDVQRLVYTDKRSGEADSLELVLENAHGRWFSAWYPKKGDRLRVSIGYEGEAMLPCGEFEIDECELSGQPDEISIKAVSAAIKKPMRTPNVRAYNGMTLASIAADVAVRHGLTLAGDPAALPLSRITQNQETDLAFLKRLADQYGHFVSVRGDQLFVAPYGVLDSRAAVLTVADRSQLKRYQVRDKTSGTYGAVSVAYTDPKSRQLIEHSEHTEMGRHGSAGGTRADTLKLNIRAENKQQAQAMAEAALRGKNLRATEGEFTLIGDIRLVAGNTLAIACLGQLNGDYLLSESRHTISRSAGWEVSVTGQRLRGVSS